MSSVLKIGQVVGLFILLLFLAGVAVYCRKQGQPRRNGIETLRQLNSALASRDSSQLFELISLPTSLAGRTVAEQSEFLVKALRDEVSDKGLSVLQREGAFGPLTNIFPAEAGAWSRQAGVNAEDCVAFKLEKNGQRAEVVLARNSQAEIQNSGLRVVRCNNVKQLAAEY